MNFKEEIFSFIGLRLLLFFSENISGRAIVDQDLREILLRSSAQNSFVHN